jgi:inner membrane protein
MSTEKNGFFDKANQWIRNSVTIRLITIGVLILLMLIPVSMVQDIIREREYRHQEAIREVSSKWGEAQVITGPVLTIPYYNYSKVYDDDNKYKLVRSREFAHFLPEELGVNGTLEPKELSRGIYEIVVYNGTLNLEGVFNRPSFDEWEVKDSDIMWDDAQLTFGLTDLRGIQEKVTVEWSDTSIEFNPGVESSDVINSGISANVPLARNDSIGGGHQFRMSIQFNGSSSLYFTPIGKTTNVSLSSGWASPKFTGAFLPDDREVNKDGFNASWKVLHLNRPYPQSFRGAVRYMAESDFGVELIVPVDEYQKSMRSAKYAVMFITLTFLIFFFIQILNKVRIHPVQYLIVGLALCVFYTLLIALSEHMPFQWSYVIAAVSIISMITLYAHNIARNMNITMLILSILVILYLFIYTIIQLEDYALLMGSVGLFLVLAIIMYLSRKIDWYNIRTGGG